MLARRSSLPSLTTRPPRRATETHTRCRTPRCRRVRHTLVCTRHTAIIMPTGTSTSEPTLMALTRPRRLARSQLRHSTVPSRACRRKRAPATQSATTGRGTIYQATCRPTPRSTSIRGAVKTRRAPPPHKLRRPPRSHRAHNPSRCNSHSARSSSTLTISRVRVKSPHLQSSVPYKQAVPKSSASPPFIIVSVQQVHGRQLIRCELQQRPAKHKQVYPR